MIKHFNNRNFRSHGIKIRSHFKTYYTAANNNKRFRDFGKIQDFTVCEDMTALHSVRNTVNGGNNCFASRCNEKLCACVCFSVGINRISFGAFAGYFTACLKCIALACFKLHFNSRNKSFYNLVFSFHNSFLIY